MAVGIRIAQHGGLYNETSASLYIGSKTLVVGRMTILLAESLLANIASGRIRLKPYPASFPSLSSAFLPPSHPNASLHAATDRLRFVIKQSVQAVWEAEMEG